MLKHKIPPNQKKWTETFLSLKKGKNTNGRKENKTFF